MNAMQKNSIQKNFAVTYTTLLVIIFSFSITSLVSAYCKPNSLFLSAVKMQKVLPFRMTSRSINYLVVNL
jgi:hypothetical protein